MGVSDHITYLLRNRYASQETTVRTGHGTVDWFKIGKGVCQLSIASPFFFNLYAEYMIQSARLEESQAGIKIAGRNNHLRYTDDTTLIAESEKELKSLLMEVKEETEKAGLKFNIQKTKIMTSNPITSWQIEGGKMGAATDFVFLGSKIIVNNDCSREMERLLLFGKKALTNLEHIKKWKHHFAEVIGVVVKIERWSWGLTIIDLALKLGVYLVEVGMSLQSFLQWNDNQKNNNICIYVCACTYVYICIYVYTGIFEQRLQKNFSHFTLEFYLQFSSCVSLVTWEKLLLCF